ncbi:AAA family ATPase [Amycolatopsis sp. A133]|uniref:AAA family ATPase n=1 Tax=Amycolatopsis sp. A133 TaxID=3064472 RepID=UPI0027F54440|nr:AAA family ATPase [Amycolatopsis sp. A133]MDQ7806260.1 AAA family ATPase [Amycolatopsis sp. A133]
MKVQECVLAEEVVPADSAEAGLWDAIVVSEGIKARLRNQALLSLLVRPDLPFEVTALHGLCTLYGPPGTGKTTLARGLAAQVAPFVPGRAVRRIEINPHGLMSAEHGQSQQRVSELLGDYVPGLASDGLPTVVILDEVESMAVARSAASLAANPADVHRATDAVLTALDLNAAEHPHLLFVATSNFTTALDEAFLSRSDAAILVPLPEPEALQEILASTLLTLSGKYPALGDLARSSSMGRIAKAANGLDGRRARKVIFEALAQRLDTVLDPGTLTEDDLAAAVHSAAVETSGPEVSRAAH